MGCTPSHQLPKELHGPDIAVLSDMDLPTAPVSTSACRFCGTWSALSTEADRDVAAASLEKALAGHIRDSHPSLVELLRLTSLRKT